MGLCASTENTSSPAGGGRGSPGSNSKDSLNRKTTLDAENVTERAVELILEAKSRRMVVADTTNIKISPDFVFPCFPKSESKKRFIKSSLGKNFFLFQELETQSQHKMIEAMEPLKVETLREKVVRQDDAQADYMYLIDSGKFEVCIDGNKVKSLNEGDVFGELALMYQAQRAATVRCVSAPAKLWRLSREVFANITCQLVANAAASNLERIQKVDLFKSLTLPQKQSIADALGRNMFRKGTKIINQGDDATAFFLVEKGSVACTDKRGDLDDIILGAGDYFGELALLNDQKRARDVICREDTTCLFMNKENFSLLLGNLNQLLDRNMGNRVLESVKLFKSVNGSNRQELLETFKERKYAMNQDIITQGESGDSFFVVREGTCDVLVDGKKTAALAAGQYFGEGSLLSGEERGATIRVTSKHFRAFELKKADFDALLGTVKKYIEKTSIERKKLSELRTIPFKSLSQSRALGQGTFGLVKLIEYNEHRFALKCLQKQQIVSYNLVPNILYEKRMMEESDHPFVLKLINTYQDPNQLYMLLEIVPGGELFAFLQKRGGKVSSPHACFITACVVSVFEYIHSKNICYRDLKPENLMIDSEGYIKMVDFGFAKVVTDKTFTLCGTPEYMAPEILLRRGHNKGVDYWATGILIYECESGTTPFADYLNYDNRVVCQNILRKPLEMQRSMGGSCRDMIKCLLARDPQKRYGCLARGCKDIKSAPYFAKIDWQKLLLKEMKAPYVPKINAKVGISNDNFEPLMVNTDISTYKGKQDIFKDF